MAENQILFNLHSFFITKTPRHRVSLKKIRVSRDNPIRDPKLRNQSPRFPQSLSISRRLRLSIRNLFTKRPSIKHPNPFIKHPSFSFIHNLSPAIRLTSMFLSNHNSIKTRFSFKIKQIRHFNRH